MKINPAFYWVIEEKNTGLKGFVVIDKYTNQRPTGGIRMAESVTLDEVTRLAREMTLKYGFLNIKKDGAKAGIIAPQGMTAIHKKTLCREFGRQIKQIITEKNYVAGEDLGINHSDFLEILAGAEIKISGANQSLNSAYYTALSVYITVHGITKAVHKTLRGAKVIIEGFGKVGEQTAKFLVEEQAKIVGISTICGAIYDENGLNMERVFKLKGQYEDALIKEYKSAEILEVDQLLIQNADILIPGARPDCINKHNVSKVQAKIIVPIANIAATEAIEEKLAQRGITYMPGFVSNCGGILCYFLVEQCFQDEIESIMKKQFDKKIAFLITKAQKENMSLSEMARITAESNLESMAKEKNLTLFQRMDPNKIMWILFKKLSSMNMEGVLRPFARRYLAGKHFN